MSIATVHITSADLELTGSYDELGDVLYLSSSDDNKTAPVQETPEGHGVRLNADGVVTHVTAINARWLLERDGKLVATLRDGRQLRLNRADLADLLG